MNLCKLIRDKELKQNYINGRMINQINTIKKLKLKLKAKEIEMEEMKKRYEIIASTDYLTNIANRRAFDATYKKICGDALNEKFLLSLIMIDIDYYKEFNDTYGHIWGDECLKRIALELSKVLSEPDEFIARYGGEEFLILLPDSDIERATAKTQNIIQSVQNLQIPHESSKVASCVTVSAGIATMILKDEHSAKSLLLLVDSALYEAKELGRNRLVRKIVCE